MIDYKDLRQFIGSESYVNVMGVNVTDGCQYLMENGVSWLITDIISVKIASKLRKEEFLSCKLNVTNSKAVLTITDGNDKTLYTQKYEYTDLNDGIIKLFLTDNVLMLSSEY